MNKEKVRRGFLEDKKGNPLQVACLVSGITNNSSAFCVITDFVFLLIHVHLCLKIAGTAESLMNGHISTSGGTLSYLAITPAQVGPLEFYALHHSR
jgi:hypothetical protein